MKQTKLESSIEVFFNYLSGFIIVYFIYKVVIFSTDYLKESAFLVTLLFTVVSVVRSYFWRRFFNSGVHKVVHRLITQAFRSMRS